MRRASRYTVGAAAVIAGGTAVIAGVSVAAAAVWRVDFSEAWRTTAQPVATVMLAAAMVAAALSVSRSLTAQRRLLTTHRLLDLEPAHVQGLRTRMLDAARMLAGDEPTLRLTAVYELFAVADDWCRLSLRSTRPERPLIEHQRCLDLICGYLRADRRLERFVPGTSIGPGTEHDERVVREQLCVGLGAHLNTWRSIGPFRVDLSGADLAGMKLRDSNFHGVVARGSVLTDADLTGADLSRSDLTDSVAANTRFTGADLSGAHLTTCTAPYATFNGADLTGADLAGAALRGASLIAANLDRADLTGTDLRAAKLMRVDLRTAAWESAELAGADLTGARPATVRNEASSEVPERTR